jgi:hypothetical protein
MNLSRSIAGVHTEMMDREAFDKIIAAQGVSLVPRPRGTKSVSAGFSLKDAFRGKVASFEDISSWKDLDRAAVCGINHLIVFDFDSEDAYVRFWDKPLVEKLASETFTVRTSRGFSNWFFDESANLAQYCSTINARPVLDMEIFIKNHLAACPENQHPSGMTYKLLGTFQIAKKSGILNEAIERLKSFGWKRPNPLDKRDFIQGIRNGVEQGQRNEVAFRFARYLITVQRFPPDLMYFELSRWNRLNRPPLESSELETIASSALKYVTCSSSERRRETVLGI